MQEVISRFLLQLQSSVTEFEFSQEEYRQLQVEFWSKFYACCLQYQEALSMPLGLTVSQHTNMVCLLKKVRKLLADQVVLLQVEGFCTVSSAT